MKNKTFYLRVINAVAIIALLLAYQLIVTTRTKNDEIAKLKADVANAKAGGQSANSAKPAGKSKLKDGTYEGSEKGYGGIVKIKVTVKDGKIARVEAVDHHTEDEAYWSIAKELLQTIVDKQSTDVDAVTGATFSSNAIINGSIKALQKAEK